jgi:CBS domain-containing protein
MQDLAQELLGPLGAWTAEELLGRPLLDDFALVHEHHPVGHRPSPRESLWQALEKVSGNGVGRVAVVDGDRLAGYLSVKDIMHVLTVSSFAPPRGERGEGRS